jgi:ubiquitin-protein ligase
MSSGAKQLSEDFKQVQKLLELYPDIKIIKTEGDPPEQYDIEYTIKGYKTDPDGTPSPDKNHEVRISLPFGYPHFPPTAKPITSIFHPDIDPDAIRIADFWQDNHSLSDLIVHIGQMICGNHYTKEDPFNQSAFEWFEERKSWLPFDILEPREEDEGEEETETEAAGTDPSDAEAQQSFAPATDLDILKDDIDFPFDDDDESGEQEDEISFAIEEDSVSDDLTDLQGDEQADEINLDFGDKETEIDDLFSLDTDEIGDDFSFDLAEEADETVSADETPPTGDLFDLETEPAGEESDEKTTLEFDPEDIASAFEEDTGDDSGESEVGDITLDDLAGLDEQEDTLDFGIGDESMDIGSEATADLSGLAEETGEETEPESDETGEEEEKILSALSLDEDLSSSNKAGDQSQIIQSLIEQKQIFSAKKVLADLPDPDSLSDKKELELTITGAVSEAEELFKKADKHEQKGEFEKAGLLLDLVANIATDFPGLDFARNRIRESMMDAGKKKPDAATDGEKTAHAREGETETSAPKKKARIKLSFKVPTRLIVTLVVVILLGGIGTGGMYVYNNDSKSIHLATKAFQKAEQLIDSKEFKGAQKELDTARATLKKILFFQGAKKEALTRKVTGLTNSSRFKEGLKGRVLYGDQYVSVETAKAIDKFNTQKRYAEQVLKSGKLEQAITALEKSLPYAGKAGFEDQVESINHKIIELRLELAMAQAKQSEEEQNWLNAEKSYRNALELSKNISSQEVQDEIALLLATASYRYALHEGLKAINNAEWQKSIDAFQTLQKILKATPQIVPETERTKANKLLIQSRLYLQLAEAKKAYENKEWDRALDIYNDTVILLKTNTNLLGKESADNIRKIEKTILTTHIAREQVQIAIARSENALDKTVEHYEAIAKLIGDSAFKDDETLAKILDDARIKTTEIKKQLLISKREKWLMDNYEKIFRDNYPSAELSDLLNPKVRFIKREGNIMIFNMSCTERKQGRKFRLELNYQHDLDKDTWTLYSGKIEEE